MRGEAVRDLLGEAMAARAEQDPGRAGPGDRLERRDQRLDLHDHAVAAAIGGVVDGAVPVGGEVAQLVQPDVESPPRDRLAEQARASGPR